jgi:pimeloyl-ACP methyl ester carboxylesterase
MPEEPARTTRTTRTTRPAGSKWSEATRQVLPIILIRGFGGLSVEDERRIAYQGFNDGTVYPQKRGENYIYEGMVLRFLKGDWTYQDATNVVGYYPKAVNESPERPEDIPDDLRERYQRIEKAGFLIDKGGVVVDPAMMLRLLESQTALRSLWILRYYDLSERKMELYGKALVRLIDLVSMLFGGRPESPVKVNVIAHSMGGLIVRHAIQKTYPDQKRRADDHINKVVTLGTPHRGIAFQVLRHWLALEASDELKFFNPEFQEETDGTRNEVSYKHLVEHFPLERFLTVVGTNYRTYGVAAASWMNRLFSEPGEFGMNYNRSDGLVKQTSAQIDGAPRTFVHKCHGGVDSLVTARESFEIATRFFFGNIRARLRLVGAEVRRGKDLFGKSEFFFGVSMKPRRVDFELFHQSPEAENCYGPFSTTDLSDKDVSFPWADENRLIWEGYLDVRKILEEETGDKSKETRGKGKKPRNKDMVFRLDFYVGERDLFGIGFSDNVVLRQQYYILTTLPEKGIPQVYCYPDERFAAKEFVPSDSDRLVPDRYGWSFNVENAGFWAKCRIELAQVPETGYPSRLESVSVLESADSPNPEPEQPAAGASGEEVRRKEGVEKGVQLRRTAAAKIPETN